MADGLSLTSSTLLDIFAPRTLDGAGDTRQEDAALALAAKANQEAFATLYHRYANSVYRYMLAYVRDVQDAQDLTEQTFLASLEGIRSYEGRGQFAAWLFGIARRKVMDYYRHAHDHVPLDSLTETAHPSRQPDQVVEERIDFEHLAQAIDTLAPDRAEVIRLRIFAELSVAEISESMGRSESAIRMLLSRAVHDLRHKMAGDHMPGTTR
jgi:RNA polymerase sigma-70 factor (ECF subfamily)